jgi:hypothetical protein
MQIPGKSKKNRRTVRSFTALLTKQNTTNTPRPQGRHLKAAALFVEQKQAYAFSVSGKQRKNLCPSYKQMVNLRLLFY